MLKYIELSQFEFVDEDQEYSIIFKFGTKTQLKNIQIDKRQILEISLIDTLPASIVEGCNLLIDRIEFDCFELIIDQQLDVKFIIENMLLVLTDMRFFSSNYKPSRKFKVNTINQLKTDYEQAYICARAYHISRSLNNFPFSICNSQSLCANLETIVDNQDIDISFCDLDQIEQLQLSGILAVAQGAKYDPIVIRIEYNPGTEPKIGLLGKGVMFDSGGYNIKTGDFSSMKTDMAGSSAVLGTIKCIADLQVNVNVVAYLVVTENLINELAFVPGDIIFYKNGVSVEIINTDAEGRLLLADGLLLLADEGCDTVVDIATLTGNSATALGKGFAPIYSTNDEVTAVFTKLNYTSTDNVWPMPLPEEYNRFIEGDISDLRNNSSSKHAGSITAAMFLKYFAPTTSNWVHIDMGAMSRRPEYGMAVNGFGVRLLTNFIIESIK